MDYLIAGAGIIGLSLALELHARGASVTVMEAGAAMRQTSSAAAGMLAVNDPLNPAALRPLAALSASLYPALLDRIADLSGTRIPFQTTATLEAGAATDALPDPSVIVPSLNPGSHHFHLLDERSMDPRQLAPALLAAVRNSTIDLRERSALQRVTTTSTAVRVQTSNDAFEAAALIDCMGTWSPAPVRPRKGQMLAVRLPSGLDLACVIRTPDIYIVPRTEGPNAGRAIIGATLEDTGYDMAVRPPDILTLTNKAAALIPQLDEAEFLESWSGLRPGTADDLPVLGATPRQPRYILATGHFRNGILLAPATALLVAQLLNGEPPSVDLTPFSPNRF